jgi:hypothetical protein
MLLKIIDECYKDWYYNLHSIQTFNKHLYVTYKHVAICKFYPAFTNQTVVFPQLIKKAFGITKSLF